MPDGQLFVPTDHDGVQRQGGESIRWPLPESEGATSEGEKLVATAGEALVLYELEDLLDVLDERIYLAQALEGADRHQPLAARLVAPTAWSIDEAARFALDCAEHAITEPEKIVFKSGESAAELIGEARRSLDRDESLEPGLLHATSRLALSRRLSRSGHQVEEAVAGLTGMDLGDGIDFVDDPAYSALASLRESILAAVEAVRHAALPSLFSAAETFHDDEEKGSHRPAVVSGGWGSFVLGSPMGALPAHEAAAEAAARGRQAAAELDGEQAARTERAWQSERLAAALGL